jgi:predicted NAD/FAD-dependent oxidoreductase
MEKDILVIGAGVAGLACASGLAAAGRRVQVLDKSRGVGGRCATRRIEGQAVDHGTAFLHGSHPEFLEAVESAGGPDLIEGWPRQIRGSGRPCQPRALGGRERRWGFATGVSGFAKYLCADLDVVLETRVVSIERRDGAFRVEGERGETREAASLVLALPGPQALDLLTTLDGQAENLAALSHLLASASTARCLTLIARFPATEAPDWEIVYPEGSRVLQMISHDSSKRRKPSRTILVLQALPCWSRERWTASEESWTGAMLAEAGRLIGDWATTPEDFQAHRWRYAFLSGGGDLTSPFSVVFDDGTRLGCVGEAFAPGGGVQAAWLSGRRLADRWTR